MDHEEGDEQAQQLQRQAGKQVVSSGNRQVTQLQQVQLSISGGDAHRGRCRVQMCYLDQPSVH